MLRVLGALLLAFNAWMLFDAYRRRAETHWLWVIVGVPGGAVAYFVLVKLRDRDMQVLQRRVLGSFQKPPSIALLQRRYDESPSFANRVRLAEPRLPEEVRRNGVTVQKQSTSFIQIVTLVSPDGLYDSVQLSNYATINVLEPLKRVPGVGSVIVFGGRDYAMRIWLRPDRIANLGITVPDIVNAINQQNQLSPAGQIGGPPAVPGTEYTYTVRTQGRLLTEEEFGEIIVRANPDGSEVRLKDVSRIELVLEVGDRQAEQVVGIGGVARGRRTATDDKLIAILDGRREAEPRPIRTQAPDGAGDPLHGSARSRRQRA